MTEREFHGYSFAGAALSRKRRRRRDALLRWQYIR
jgi:hypothetical protein